MKEELPKLISTRSVRTGSTMSKPVPNNRSSQVSALASSLSNRSSTTNQAKETALLAQLGTFYGYDVSTV